MSEQNESIYAGHPYYEIGKSEKLMEFLDKNKCEDMDGVQKRVLSEGALEALKLGRAENIQTIFGITDSVDWHLFVFCEVEKILQDTKDQESILALLMEKIPEEKRQNVLDDLLNKTFDSSHYPALIAAGAKVTTELLIKAVSEEEPEDIIRLLHENGADFDKAIKHVQLSREWDGDARRDTVQKLKIYRETFTGQPVTKEGAMLKELAAVRGELAALRSEFTALREAFTGGASVTAGKQKSGGQKSEVKSSGRKPPQQKP